MIASSLTKMRILMNNAEQHSTATFTSTHFANFWAKGVEGDFSCWKFSDKSQEDAQKLADDRVLQIAERFRKEGRPPDSYTYSDQRLREPVITEIPDGVISRNSYGCLVLNTSNVMFVDIDFPELKEPGILDRLKRLFKSVPVRNFEAEITQNVEDWTNQNIGWGWRIYRTFAGMRLIATNDCFEPDSVQVQKIFKELGADPNYRILCKVQQCFRARLTPKPWRCDISPPSARWPWASEKEATNFKIWDVAYALKSKEFATCRFIKTIGNLQVHASVSQIVVLHDDLCRANIDLPLA
jgi:hypothetical protein